MDRLADPAYHHLLRTLAQGYPFPAAVANRLVFLRLLVEGGAIHEGLPGGRTAHQEPCARILWRWGRRAE